MKKCKWYEYIPCLGVFIWAHKLMNNPISIFTYNIHHSKFIRIYNILNYIISTISITIISIQYGILPILLFSILTIAYITGITIVINNEIKRSKNAHK